MPTLAAAMSPPFISRATPATPPLTITRQLFAWYLRHYATPISRFAFITPPALRCHAIAAAIAILLFSLAFR